MTVSELIKALEKYPQDMRVVYPITQCWCDIEKLEVTQARKPKDEGVTAIPGVGWDLIDVGDPFLELSGPQVGNLDH